MKDNAAFPAHLQPSDTFVRRHIGPREAEWPQMLAAVGAKSLDELIDQTIPRDIRMRRPLRVGPPRGEHELLRELKQIVGQNRVLRSLIGMGYYDTITPPVIQRNLFENPGWYTQYTPYQAEIAQGRLEAMLNFQTMVADLTALPLANASLLDEATAAAEAMHMCQAATGEERNAFFVGAECHPQTIAVIQTRAWPLGIRVEVGDPERIDWKAQQFFGVLIQYPNTYGAVRDYAPLTQAAHAAGAMVVVATDLLALTLLKPPGEWGADIAVGSAQRFGVPLGFGGPHAAFMACKDEHRRQLPGRLIGVSKDRHGRPAYRLTLQTREQHIRRDKATSNICTAQALLANMAGMYAVYHGPKGLRRIAERVHAFAKIAAAGLERLGWDVGSEPFFDTLHVRAERRRPRRADATATATATAPTDAAAVRAAAEQVGLNLRYMDDGSIGISFDELTDVAEVERLWAVFNGGAAAGFKVAEFESALNGTARRAVAHSDGTAHRAVAPADGTAHRAVAPADGTAHRAVAPADGTAHRAVAPADSTADRAVAHVTNLPPQFARETAYLTHPVFNSHHSETEMLRYLYTLQQRDLSLATSMIPLGSCTMKLNGTSEMLPVTWAEVGGIHPFAPPEQTRGYQQLCAQLEQWLAEITGFAAVSLQPNAGAQGEYAGLLVIRAYHEGRGEKQRNVCLIPVSAHGTNPASAIMAGFDVVPVACDAAGNIDGADLRKKLEQHRDRLGALMITYPSTHGVFEEHVPQICALVHEHGGQVYMDGANMNAQVGLTRPADIGADVCHLNLHKTFCIPHGGGGPGMGPIGVSQHLAPYLPGHPVIQTGGEHAIGPVSAAPWGSAGILPISWVYIALMGGEGLTCATQIAILNANYMAARLREHYPLLYAGRNGRVAHEFILDLREFKRSAGIEPDDVAKRLIDYGFHAPTMSWPVPGTLMIEPTESEPLAELDRFCEAMIAIRAEISAIETGAMPRDNNPLKNAPHTAEAIASSEWPHPYPREQAAFPLPWVHGHKFWPAVGRIDNVWGDRNLFCTCPPMEAMAQASMLS